MSAVHKFYTDLSDLIKDADVTQECQKEDLVGKGDWRLYKLLVGSMVLVILANVYILLDYFSTTDYHAKSFKFFVLDFENNLRSWFSSMILALTSWTLWRNGQDAAEVDNRYAWGWKALAVVFALLSFDEFATYHEMLDMVASEYLVTAWYIVVLPVVCAIGMGLLSFLRRLPAKFFLLFVVGGSLYIAGAVVIESGTRRHWANFGRDQGYYLGVSIEESLEMIGVLFFLYALLKMRSIGLAAFAQRPPIRWSVFLGTIAISPLIMACVGTPYIAYVESRSFEIPNGVLKARSLVSTTSRSSVKVKNKTRSVHGRWSSKLTARVYQMKNSDEVSFRLPVNPGSTFSLDAFLGATYRSRVYAVSIDGQFIRELNLCGRGKLAIPTGPVRLGEFSSKGSSATVSFRLISANPLCSARPVLYVDGFHVQEVKL